MKKFALNYFGHKTQLIRQTFQINPPYNSIEKNVVTDSEYLFSLIQAFSSLNKRQDQFVLPVLLSFRHSHETSYSNIAHPFTPTVWS